MTNSRRPRAIGCACGHRRPLPKESLVSTVLNRNPATRLFAFEALGTVLCAVPMLMVTASGHPRVPEWAQLLGLALLLTMIGALTHTCRLTIADGLRLITCGATGQGEGAA